jgi:hypothetical protein
MDENEFASTPVVSALNDYLESAGGVVELTGTIYHVFDAAVAKAYGGYAPPSERNTPQWWSRASHQRSQHEVLTPSSTRVVGCVEALVTDLCGKMLQLEPELF